MRSLDFPGQLSIIAMENAGVAQLVEHHVANVVVAGSNPVTRFSFCAWRARTTSPMPGVSAFPIMKEAGIPGMAC